MDTFWLNKKEPYLGLCFRHNRLYPLLVFFFSFCIIYEQKEVNSILFAVYFLISLDAIRTKRIIHLENKI